MTSSMTPSMTNSESCRLYDLVVCGLLIGAFCLFGLVGNSTSFVVFCRQHKTGAAAAAVLLLECMAVCDSLLLVVAVAVYVVPAVYLYTGIYLTPGSTCTLVCAYCLPVHHCLPVHRTGADRPRHVLVHRLRLATSNDLSHGDSLAHCARVSQQVQRRLSRCRGVWNDQDVTSNSHPDHRRRHCGCRLQCSTLLRAPGKLAVYGCIQ